MDARFHDDVDFALSWVVDEQMERASHALVDEGRVWLIDPVGWEPALERVVELGTPVAVLQLLDRHARDSDAIARRLGVPLLRLPDALPGTPFEVVPLVRRRWWRESALWWPQRRVLVVPESVGSGSYFALGDGPLGVHPMMRLTPPTALRPFDPEHLLVGHGAPLHHDASAALATAIGRSRSDIPRGIARLPKLLRG
ncbi:hypothetical protein PAI11_03970 [Patulibacter medicamentivorans]|jgi:hypothetical protein|uniref:Metallo-beta-lactamase domain-containing protein n=1 Tax=Patulibacter medicamentivorans TaxID=1097667 RepID=H0E0T9_9ACTN|nr:hypothetical protein [Patulibacter medicamentivorans]EHN12703.1 hypothetical protein PAI11_03970 [Patulibacter medicamentivorans]